MKILLLALCALQDPEPPKEVVVGAELKESADMVRLEGTCNLPDGVQLSVVFRLGREMVGDAGDLTLDRLAPHRQTALVLDHHFRVHLPLFAPGRHTVEVSVLTTASQEELSKTYRKLPGIDKVWTFEYGGWKADLPAKMAEKLSLLRTLIGDLRTYIGKLEAATETEERWYETKNRMRNEGLKLKHDVEQLIYAADSLSATATYLNFVADALNEKSAAFIFVDGKLTGARVQGKRRSRYDGPLFWDAYRNAMDESLKIAGREFALWTVKLLREKATEDWPAIRDSLAMVKASPELAPWLERLRTCKPADLDAFEKELRAPTIEVPKK